MLQLCKKSIYAREQVQHLWLVDPLAKTVENFKLQNGKWLELSAFAGNVQVRLEPFEATELDLTHWWLPED